ncbi:hypothetical protein C8046_17345 [Serinibacter arcticus]|uniref:Uncharacterized protein n=1 Tax=Serinibacter arcticus TaxID=1655435 RepID=A0A2U1ZYT1_9MICO|nr:hypothetical protein [Serinibacter arcticus]PWD52146.1 hypothetical protein C8046_17345 [Serinibacter arcticus]
MSWDELFEDLESQADAAAREADEDDVAELGEAEQGRIALADRLRACVGRPVVVGVDGDSHAGTVRDATRAWVVLATAVREVLVPLTAVRWVEGADRAAPAPGAAESRLGLSHVLRGLQAEGRTVRMIASGRTVVGVIDRVGLDHADVVDDGNGTVLAVPFVAITSVTL